MFYNNNPVTQFLNSFYDSRDIGVRQLSPEQQFNSVSNSSSGVNNTVEKQLIFQQILAQLAGSIDSRANLFARLRNFKDDPLAITMIDIFIEDAFSQTDNKDFYEITFSPMSNSDEEEELTDEEKEVDEQERKRIQDIINETEKKFLLKSKFKNILFDFLLLGEWMWSTKYEKGKGLVEILDNKLVDNIIGIYREEVISSYVELTTSSRGEINGGIREIPKDEILHLVLNPGTIRFYITEGMLGSNGTSPWASGSNSMVSGWNNNSSWSNFNSSNTIDDPNNNYRLPNDAPPKGAKMLSKYIRTGRSVLYSSLKTLEKIALLDMTNMAMLLKRALSPTIMSVQVPESYSYKKALEAASAYEQWFYDSNEDQQNTFSSTSVDNINFNRIMELSQKFKCMPVWGDSKGVLQTLNLDDARDNREALEDYKRELATTSGLPYYYFNPEAGGAEKKETLKTHARYARKLHVIQQSLANSPIEVHYKDLKYKGIKYKGEDIKREDLAVKFKSIVNSDSLESIEQIINLFTALNEIVSSLDTYASSQSLHVKVITSAFMKYFRFITQSYPFINEVLEEAPEQIETDNPDMLVGNLANATPAQLGLDPNQNPIDQQAMMQAAQENPEDYQEAYELFGTNNLHETIPQIKQLTTKMTKQSVKYVNEKANSAVISEAYRYSANSF